MPQSPIATFSSPANENIDAESESASVTVNQVASCCGLRRWVGVAMVATTLGSLGLVAYFAGQLSVAREQAAPVYFPPIDATAAVASEKFSMATGAVSDQAEGLFVLDHNSGLLQCSVMYPMVGSFMGIFTTNVADVLATGGKGGQYMMVTGLADFPRSSTNPAAPALVYVLDTSTGNYVCYGIPFNDSLMNARRPQQGTMKFLGKGTANPVIDPDNLR